MKHIMTTRYPAHSDVVIRMMTDRDFHTRKLEAMGLSHYRVLDHACDGQDFRIRIERKVPVQMPGLKGAGESTVINDERWSIGAKTGGVTVEPQGMPVDMTCTTQLCDDGGDCVLTFEWDINARIPVVGKTLEKFIVADMERRAADEARVSIALLDAYR